MAVKAPVFDRHEGLGDMFGQICHRNGAIDYRAAPGDEMAVGGHEADAWRRDRLQRSRKRRGDCQPGYHEHQQCEQSSDDPSCDMQPPSPGRGWSEGAGWPCSELAGWLIGLRRGQGIFHWLQHAVLSD